MRGIRAARRKGKIHFNHEQAIGEKEIHRVRQEGR